MPMYEAIYFFRVKRTPLSARRKLTIDPLFLEFEGPRTNARITKDDMEGFRYGLRVLRFYIITIRKTYTLEVKSSSGKIISIRMHVFFGIGNKKIRAMFISIYKIIHSTYFKDMVVHYVRLLKGGLPYELAGAMLNSEGILLGPKKECIPWLRVGLKLNYLACYIYDLADPLHFRSFDYWQDWNASLLYSVVNYKLKSDTAPFPEKK